MPYQSQELVQFNVDVLFEDRRPVGGEKRVELLTPGGIPITSTETNIAGRASFSGVRPGRYQLRVRGKGIDETNLGNIAVSTSPGPVIQVIYVRRSMKDARTLEGRVSAVELAIPEKAKAEVVKSVAALRKDRLFEAQERIMRVVRAYPEYAEAYNVLGIIYMKQKDVAQAKQAFSNALRYDDMHPAANLNLGKILMNDQRYAEAEPLVYRSTISEPKNAEGWTVLALAQLSQEKLDAAIASTRRAHSLPHSQFPICHLVAAGAWEKRGDPIAAAAELKMFLAESPDSPVSAKLASRLLRLEARQ